MYLLLYIYEDEFNDRKVSLLDFDKKEYVLPIKAALAEFSEIQ